MEFELDSLDRKILRFLQKDARMPYLEIARELKVSGGTIHQRINKLTEQGIITGSKIVIDWRKLGFDVTVLVGVYLTNARDCPTVLDKLNNFDEVLEAYYTTGNYALLLKVAVKTIQDFQNFLMNKLQTIKEIQSTESFICLDSPIIRDIKP